MFYLFVLKTSSLHQYWVTFRVFSYAILYIFTPSNCTATNTQLLNSFIDYYDNDDYYDAFCEETWLVNQEKSSIMNRLELPNLPQELS